MTQYKLNGVEAKNLETTYKTTAFETRDIWEYQLTLSEDQRELLLDLIWELKQNARFDYYFFKENCSYILLALIEAVRSDFRPSIRRELLHKYNTLSGPEKTKLRNAIKGESRPERSCRP